MKHLVLFSLLALAACSGTLTPSQQAVNAQEFIDQEGCQRTASSAQNYVNCADKVQKCAQTNTTIEGYNSCINFAPVVDAGAEAGSK